MLVDVLLMAGLLTVLSLPLCVSGWAFLDAARRPSWVWAFAGRRQVLWMSAIFIGVTTLLGGVLISSWYLARVRPELASIEAGRL